MLTEPYSNVPEEANHNSLRNRETGEWMNQQNVREVKRFDEFTTIDWVEDELYEHWKRLSKNKSINSRATSFKDKLISTTQNWFVLGIMGVTIGLIAGCLNVITAWLTSIRMGHCRGNFYLNKTFCCWDQDEDKCANWVSWSRFGIFNYVIYVFISVLLALSAATLVKRYAPSAAGSGISEIKCIVSGFVMKGFLGWWTLLIKSIGLPLAIGSGLSVGKEGPSVHYAVCVGNSIAKMFGKYRKSASKAREFLTATSAAGVAVAFGSPMGGVLFSIEDISTVFQLSTIWKSYFCSLIAVITLAAINPFRTGQLVMFEVTYNTNWHYFEIPFYIILGVFGGVYGIIVSKLNLRVVSFRKRYLSNMAVREVVILSSLTACFCYFNEFLRLDMTESMQILFNECDTGSQHAICKSNSNKVSIFMSLIFATFARMVLTIFSYGCKVPAGIFVPSMATGATFGRAIGMIVERLYQSNKESSLFLACPTNGDKCIIPGTYAFLGAAAALSGITHLTVTVVIIMFELTGALRYIIPTMIVVAITTSINDRYGKGGIAEQMIKFNGLPLIESKEEYKFNTSVNSAMSNATVAFPSTDDEGISLNKLKKILGKNSYIGYPIIQSFENPRVIGYITRADIDYVLANSEDTNENGLCNFGASTHELEGHIDFAHVINRHPFTVNVNTTLEYVLDIFVKLGPRVILVEQEGLLVGLITRKDILRYEYTSHALHADSNLEAANIEFEEKVWRIMNHFGIAVKKNIGRLIHNDENRYIYD